LGRRQRGHRRKGRCVCVGGGGGFELRAAAAEPVWAKADVCGRMLWTCGWWRLVCKPASAEVCVGLL